MNQVFFMQSDEDTIVMETDLIASPDDFQFGSSHKYKLNYCGFTYVTRINIEPGFKSGTEMIVTLVRENNIDKNLINIRRSIPRETIMVNVKLVEELDLANVNVDKHDDCV